VASLLVAFGFSVGLGVATVTIPLLALDAGYDAATVGFLVAASAASQLGGRLLMPWLLGRYADRTLIGLSCALMTTGFGLLLVTTALPAFVLAQLFQGGARAVFWTSSQTHAIRGDGEPIARLVDLNAAGNAGTLIGPTLAGMLAVLGLPLAVGAAAAGAILAGLGVPLLTRLPSYDRARSVGTMRLLHRDGVDIACWSSVIGGGWWSMIGSYIPVILVGAGIGPAGIGWLITASEGASVVILLTLRRTDPANVRPTVRIGSLGVVACLAGLTVVPGGVLGYLALLVLGGAASGTITALAPALASLAANADEQGDVMSLTGTFRAAALLAAPATVGALLSVIALGPALVLVSAALGLSGVAVGRGTVSLADRPAR